MVNTEYQSSNETLWSCSLRCQTICLANQGSSASGQFVVTAFICGISCRILFDTGASVCFVAADHNIINESSNCSDRNSHYTSGGLQICLGDDSKIATQGCVQLPFSISGKQYAWDFHVMTLPAGIDVIIGMDFMRFHDVTLMAADERVLFGNTLMSMGSAECQMDPPEPLDHTCRMHEIASDPTEACSSNANTDSNKTVLPPSGGQLYPLGDGIEVDFVTSNEFEKLNLLAASPGVTVDSLWQLYSNGRYENAANDKRRIVNEREWRHQGDPVSKHQVCFTAIARHTASDDCDAKQDEKRAAYLANSVSTASSTPWRPTAVVMY